MSVLLWRTAWSQNHQAFFPVSDSAMVSLSPMPVLSRVQQNDIYEIAEKARLNPLDFDWTTELQNRRGLTEIIKHRPTHGRCEFSDAHEGKIWLTWWPKFRNGNATFFAAGWADAVTTIRQWMAEVEGITTHLTSGRRRARRGSSLMPPVTSTKTTPLFSLAEIQLLKPKLDEVESYIQSRQPLDEHQKRIISGRFQYLLEAAKRGLGRIDWIAESGNNILTNRYQFGSV